MHEGSKPPMAPAKFAITRFTDDVTYPNPNPLDADWEPYVTPSSRSPSAKFTLEKYTRHPCWKGTKESEARKTKGSG
ncbi:hypothetical protein N7451_006507 [Penicillium sp. IBT 35674x]|nr:hypothetical protein N7451_006507 [Penicillium sp. IBT 35674x]